MHDCFRSWGDKLAMISSSPWCVCVEDDNDSGVCGEDDNDSGVCVGGKMITIVVCVCGRVCTCCSSVLLGSRRVLWDITEIGRFLRSKNSDCFLVSSAPSNV